MKRIALAFVAFLVLVGAVVAYDTTETSEIGYPGVGMQTTDTVSNLEDKIADNRVPVAIPQSPPGGARAIDVYENVQVLGHLSTAQFTRLMASITTWVAPVQGCNYCHNANNLASDEKYQKVVSRRMLQMTQHINENWQSHVQQTGVTCYTCHRGKNVPEYIWFDETPLRERMVGGAMANQNRASMNTGSSSLPGNPFSTFLVEDEHNIRVQSAGELFPSNDNRSSIKQTEWTYGLMMHFSNALGINCTGCHNSRSWNDWSQSPQRRATAWYGIRMVRNLNAHWLNPLQPIYPEHRLGETGDAPKANCMTCHQGAYKPLLGQSMLQDFPALSRAWPQPVKAKPEPKPMPTEAPAGEED
jgi:photosynthetic reaction center cytochrome c subunit